MKIPAMKRFLGIGSLLVLLAAAGLWSWRNREAPFDRRIAGDEARGTQPVQRAGVSEAPRSSAPPYSATRHSGPASDAGGGAAASGSSPERGSAGPMASSGDHSLAGVIAGPNGDPIEGAMIRLLPPAGRGGSIASAARSDGSGRFAFRGLPPGAQLLTARARGHLSAINLEVEIPAATPLRIVLEPDRPARMRILDESGSPISGAKVAARLRIDSGSVPGGSTRAASDADGWLELSRLPASDSVVVLLTVQTLGRPPISLERTAGDLRAQTCQIVVPAGGRIAGIVVTESGEAAVGARIVLAPSQPVSGEAVQSKWTHQTGPDGRFEFPGLATGEFTLFADGGERGARRLMGVQPAAGGGTGSDSGILRIVLAAAGTPEARDGVAPAPVRSVQSLRHGTRPGMGTIRGRLQTLHPPAGFAIGLAPEGEADGEPRHLYRQSGRRPEFTLLNIPAGTYELLYITEGKVRSKVAGVKVEAGREAGPIELPGE